MVSEYRQYDKAKSTCLLRCQKAQIKCVDILLKWRLRLMCLELISLIIHRSILQNYRRIQNSNIKGVDLLQA